MLTEDQCLGTGKDFDQELATLQADGYKITNQYNHPAVGRVVELEKEG